MKQITIAAIKALLFYAIVSTISPSATLFALPDTVTVATVTGVDSFIDTEGNSWGLLGITKPKGKGVTGKECVTHLASLIEGKSVLLIADSTVVDSPGKTPQRLLYLEADLVNLKMILDGYARASKRAHQLSDSFADAERTAHSEHRGAHATERSTAVQCSGHTQSGRRCRRMTNNLSGRCWQH